MNSILMLFSANYVTVHKGFMEFFNLSVHVPINSIVNSSFTSYDLNILSSKYYFVTDVSIFSINV